MEIFTGSVDEECLIGERTKMVASSIFAQSGTWGRSLAMERAAEDGEFCDDERKERWANGRELAVPKKHFFYRNSVRGTTDRAHVLTDEVGERWVEDTMRGWKIPD